MELQDRYTGDIGDYVKYGLLRALTGDEHLGIAWYLYPDESHNADGRHIDYLGQPAEWAEFDSSLFYSLKNIVAEGNRSVQTVEKAKILPGASFANEPLDTPVTSVFERATWRREWFERVLAKLSDCEIVFADPDNGLCADEKFSLARRGDWKRMPLQEAIQLSKGRTAILYHHNSRFAGGHRAEIKHWMERLPGCAYGLYWRRYSNRTFFVINPSLPVERRLKEFAARWGHEDELICNR